jgi:hypothetical protein
MSLTGEFCLTVWLLFACDFLSLFPSFLLLLFGDAGADSLRVDFEERSGDAQGVVLFVFGRPFGIGGCKATREAGSRPIAPFHKTRELHRIITPEDSPFPIKRGNESDPRFPTPHPPHRSGRYVDGLPARLPYVLADFFPLTSLESGRLRSENRDLNRNSSCMVLYV